MFESDLEYYKSPLFEAKFLDSLLALQEICDKELALSHNPNTPAHGRPNLPAIRYYLHSVEDPIRREYPKIKLLQRQLRRQFRKFEKDNFEFF